MMKLNILGSEIWPEMAWESCQAAVKPNFNFLNKWGHLLFRKLKFGPLKDKKIQKIWPLYFLIPPPPPFIIFYFFFILWAFLSVYPKKNKIAICTIILQNFFKK